MAHAPDSLSLGFGPTSGVLSEMTILYGQIGEYGDLELTTLKATLAKRKAHRNKQATHLSKRATGRKTKHTATIAMPARAITVNASAFKAHCLELLRRLEVGYLRRVTVTRRGKPVAEIAPPARDHERQSLDSLFGFMRGAVKFAPDYDPLERVVDEPSDPFLDRPANHGAA